MLNLRFRVQVQVKDILYSCMESNEKLATMCDVDCTIPGTNILMLFLSNKQQHDKFAIVETP
jgi:hypothetical protein